MTTAAVGQLSFSGWFSKALAELSSGACGTLVCVTPGLKGFGSREAGCSGRDLGTGCPWCPRVPTALHRVTLVLAGRTPSADGSCCRVCDPAVAARLMGTELSQLHSFCLCCRPPSLGTRSLVTVFLLLRKERALFWFL